MERLPRGRGQVAGDPSWARPTGRAGSGAPRPRLRRRGVRPLGGLIGPSTKFLTDDILDLFWMALDNSTDN